MKNTQNPCSQFCQNITLDLRVSNAQPTFTGSQGIFYSQGIVYRFSDECYNRIENIQLSFFNYVTLDNLLGSDKLSKLTSLELGDPRCSYRDNPGIYFTDEQVELGNLIIKHASNLRLLNSLNLVNLCSNRKVFVSIIDHLNNFPNLQHLILPIYDGLYGDKVAQTIIKYASNFKQLHSLELIGGRVHSAAMQDIVSAIIGISTNLSQLRNLKLSGLGIGIEGTELMAAHSEDFKNLRSLSLSQNNIGNDGIRVIVEHAVNFTCLQILDVSNNGIGDQGAKAMAEHANEFVQLHSLYLDNSPDLDRDNVIGVEGITAIASLSGNFNHLQAFYISGNRIGDDGIKAIAEHAVNFTHLCVLDVSNNGIGVAGAKAIGEHAKDFKNLRSLSLSKNNIGDDGIKAIAEHAINFTCLESLDISSSGIGYIGVRMLIEHASDFMELQALALNNNNIGDEGIKSLAAAILNFPKLQMLNLTIFGEAMVNTMLEHMSDLVHLQNLNMNFDAIGDVGLTKLAEHASNFTMLLTLDLSNNDIGGPGVNALIAHASDFLQLKSINLGNNPIVVPAALELAAHAENFKHLELFDLTSHNLISDRGRQAWIEHAQDLMHLPDECLYNPTPAPTFAPTPQAPASASSSYEPALISTAVFGAIGWVAVCYLSRYKIKQKIISCYRWFSGGNADDEFESSYDFDMPLLSPDVIACEPEEIKLQGVNAEDYDTQ